MKRGEIWLVRLNPTVGAEIQKTRPVVIVNDDKIGLLPLKIIVPVTEWQETFSKAPWMVKVVPDKRNNLYKASVADAFQVRSVSQERFIKKTGSLSEEQMAEITDALAVVLKIE